MIIGVVGPIASGKDAITDFLIELGFKRWNISDEVREEAKTRGISIERKNLQDLGNEMRERYGKGYWVKRIIEKIDLNENHSIAGIRNTGEVEECRKLKEFILIGIDAPIEKRIEWIIKRNKDSDPKTADEIIKMDSRDRGAGESLSGQQVDACYKLADRYVINDGTKEQLKEKAENLLIDIGVLQEKESKSK